MVRVDKVSKYFGGRVLFEGISLPLEPRARIGLIGPNGAGKTTLFGMIAGFTEPDAGRVIVPRGMTIGHLPQDVGDIGEAPLVDYVLAGRGDIVQLHERFAEIGKTLEGGGLDDEAVVALAGEMSELSERLAVEGGYDLEARAESILLGMGFRVHELRRPASELSGGWRVRLVLSRLLLQRPDVLLLDEPTNHLDVPSVEWLESFLDDYEGTVVVISHDRYFLNRLVSSIAALEPQGLHFQPGNYDAYEEGLEERIAAIDKAKMRQDREIRQLQDFVDRFRAKATKAKQAQSRVKRLAKIQRIETFEQKKTVRRFAFAEAPREGKEVVTVDGVGKRYGDKVVYSDLNFALFRSERVVLVGPNGEGKTTLLKLIVGDTEPQTGTIALGHNVMPAYFGQHQVEELDLDRTLLQEMEAFAPVDAIPRCRSILGSFLFTGADADKKIGVLSGGERNRLALAKLLLRPTNLLILDEPTNHLDMDSRETLLEALDAFSGTILFVSHDRFFINELATRVVHVEAGRAVSYDGDYDYYRHKRLQQAATDKAQELSAKSNDTPDTGRKEQRKRDAALRNELGRRTADARQQLEQLEARVASLEKEKREISSRLADPLFFASAPSADISQLTDRFDTVAVQLERAIEQWGEATETLERAEEKIRSEFEA